ncbi:hypothetical protein H4R33_001144 [Dimargaris cristalligena]|nr:hypothetical protein H4R33_001144 [Dimargaris cristalligena]
MSKSNVALRDRPGPTPTQSAPPPPYKRPRIVANPTWAEPFKRPKTRGRHSPFNPYAPPNPKPYFQSKKVKGSSIPYPPIPWNQPGSQLTPPRFPHPKTRHQSPYYQAHRPIPYRPPRRPRTVDGSEVPILVSDLPSVTTAREVARVFEKWGSVHLCHIMTDEVTGLAKPEALVVFKPRPAPAYLDQLLYPERYPPLHLQNNPIRFQVRDRNLFLGALAREGTPPTQPDTTPSTQVPQPVPAVSGQSKPTGLDHVNEVSLNCVEFHCGVMLSANEYLSEWHTAEPTQLVFEENRNQLHLFFRWKATGAEYKLTIDSHALAEPIRMDSRPLPALPYQLAPGLLSASPAGPFNDRPTGNTPDPKSGSALRLLIQLTQPPLLFRKNEAQAERDHRRWHRMDIWERVTGVALDSTQEPGPLEPVTAGLERSGTNFGHWLVYHLVAVTCEPMKMPTATPQPSLVTDNAPRMAPLVAPDSREALEELWLNNQKAIQLLRQPHRFIGWQFRQAKRYPRLLAHSQHRALRLADLGATRLHFEVHYMLESLVSHGILSEYNLTTDFLDELARLPAATACRALQFLFGQQGRIYQPLRELQTIEKMMPSDSASSGTAAASSSSAPSASTENGSHRQPQSPTTPIFAFISPSTNHSVMIPKVIVTPTRVYLLPPTVESSNRVLRHYAHLKDRFLRVSFRDERFNRLDSNPVQLSSIYSRVYRALRHGIQLSGRHYEFLAFSASQLRNHSCWFFAPEQASRAENHHPNDPLTHGSPVTASDIRQWMGHFMGIANVAKAAARMGQCFSTTTAVCSLPVDNVYRLEDVSQGKYVFSDGVGQVSPALMALVARQQGFDRPPSAIQFRFGGHKGVLALAPPTPNMNDQVHAIALRPSQEKFPCEHRVLEIVQPAIFTPCTLNRQLILLLATLGVPDSTFLRLQNVAVKVFRDLQHHADVAMQFLKCQGGDAPFVRWAIPAIDTGFFRLCDPFLVSSLQCFSSGCLKALQERARIPIDKGAKLMGVVDELGLLQPNEIFVRYSDPQSPDNKQVVTGLCVIGRNPCFHPGDVRVVKAVDHPQLHFLTDVVVFSRLGERDLPSQLCGGDLDGDFYSVIWDPCLVPTKAFMNPVPPMDYSAPPPPAEPGMVIANGNTDARVKNGGESANLPPPPTAEQNLALALRDMQRFFLSYIVSDNLGQIANAHLIRADRSPNLAKHPDCIRLAELHSLAVDFPKSGVPAEMPSYLRPFEYPDFMAKPDKTPYRSISVLGKLFRAVRWSPDEDFMQVDVSPPPAASTPATPPKVSPSTTLVASPKAEIAAPQPLVELTVQVAQVGDLPPPSSSPISSSCQTLPPPSVSTTPPSTSASTAMPTDDSRKTAHKKRPLLSTQVNTLLQELVGPDFVHYVVNARQIRKYYNQTLATMLRQYGIRTEQELVGVMPLQYSHLVLQKSHEFKETLKGVVKQFQAEFEELFFAEFGSDSRMLFRRFNKLPWTTACLLSRDVPVDLFTDASTKAHSDSGSVEADKAKADEPQAVASSSDASAEPSTNPLPQPLSTRKTLDTITLARIRAKAMAWYYVTYHPLERYGSKCTKHDHLARALQQAGIRLPPKPDQAEHKHFISFPWCVPDVLTYTLKWRLAMKPGRRESANLPAPHPTVPAGLEGASITTDVSVQPTTTNTTTPESLALKNEAAQYAEVGIKQPLEPVNMAAPQLNKIGTDTIPAIGGDFDDGLGALLALVNDL